MVAKILAGACDSWNFGWHHFSYHGDYQYSTADFDTGYDHRFHIKIF